MNQYTPQQIETSLALLSNKGYQPMYYYSDAISIELDSTSLAKLLETYEHPNTFSLEFYRANNSEVSGPFVGSLAFTKHANCCGDVVNNSYAVLDHTDGLPSDILTMFKKSRTITWRDTATPQELDEVEELENKLDKVVRLLVFCAVMIPVMLIQAFFSFVSAPNTTLIILLSLFGLVVTNHIAGDIKEEIYTIRNRASKRISKLKQ